jgi:hypothetical protein
LAELRPSRTTQIEVLGVPGELAFYEPTNRHNPRVGGDRRRNVCPAPGSTELGSAPKAVQIDIPLRHQRAELDFGLCHDLQAKIRAFSPNVAQRTRLVMSKVFVSYRHDDSGADAGRLYDTLAAELGQDALYKDVENITIGRNWKRAVREALADSAAVLFVMGPVYHGGQGWIDFFFRNTEQPQWEPLLEFIRQTAERYLPSPPATPWPDLLKDAEPQEFALPEEL